MKRMLSSLKVLLLTTICILLISVPALALSQSKDVAIIGSPSVSSGGYLPTDIPGISFTPLAPGDVNPTELAKYDTVVLNVASPEMGGTTDTLTAQAKVDLVNFVGSGKKLIIYDSECPPVNYNWLPFPFTTDNPGQMGAYGTLTIVEENTLSTSTPGDPYYIDAATLGSQTDAVGDMNVMTTMDGHWCVDMSGTNHNGVTGPVHTYADYSPGTGASGLIIYNGLDLDTMGWNTPFGLRQIWIQELMQPFNPSNLPGSVAVVGITLDPATAQNEVGTKHTVTATLKDLLGNPQPGITVTFKVTTGPNAGVSGSATTDASGIATFTYTGIGVGKNESLNYCFLHQDRRFYS